MKISVFGMGYVGVVLAGCLAKEGNEVIGIDVNTTKVSLINEGKSPIVEKGIGEILSHAVKGSRTGSLRAKTDPMDAVMNSDVSFVCVGTPSNDNGGLNLEYVKKCCAEIGEGMANKNSFHIVVMRSTVLPGTIEDVVIPLLEDKSGKKCDEDFGVVMNPEFLREGTSVHDFYNPSFTVIGESDFKSGDVVKNIYDFVQAPVVKTEIRYAEMIKYACNAFHALKVTFANEIGNICKKLDIDSHKVMDIFVMDNKLNISSYYLKPGFAFGGSCLPKDLRALIYKANQKDVELALIRSILPANENQVRVAVDMVKKTGKKRVGILGFSFKAGTDDLREGPIVELIERLIGKGYSIKAYDKNVSLANLIGANKEFIEREIPHIARLMCRTIDEVLRNSEVIVVGNSDEEFKGIEKMCSKEQIIIDLCRIYDDIEQVPDNYRGICW